MKFIKGKDLLFRVGEKCVGSCTEHTVNYNTSTSDVAVKPPASAPATSGMFKEKLIDGMDITVDFKGLRAVDEEEASFEEMAAKWGAGEPIECAGFKRSEDDKPHLKGMFVITSLTETNGADGNAEYSGSLAVYGEPEIYPGKKEAAKAE